MNKYVLDKRKSIIKLNTDTLDIKYIDTAYDIDYMWVIDEGSNTYVPYWQ